MFEISNNFSNNVNKLLTVAVYKGSAESSFGLNNGFCILVPTPTKRFSSYIGLVRLNPSNFVRTSKLVAVPSCFGRLLKEKKKLVE